MREKTKWLFRCFSGNYLHFLFLLLFSVETFRELLLFNIHENLLWPGRGSDRIFYDLEVMTSLSSLLPERVIKHIIQLYDSFVMLFEVNIVINSVSLFLFPFLSFPLPCSSLNLMFGMVWMREKKNNINYTSNMLLFYIHRTLGLFHIQKNIYIRKKSIARCWSEVGASSAITFLMERICFISENLPTNDFFFFFVLWISFFWLSHFQLHSYNVLPSFFFTKIEREIIY